MKIQDVYEYRLNQIYEEKNDKLKNELLKLRMDAIKELAQDRISRKIILENQQLSVLELTQMIHSAYCDGTSSLYFPGDICCFYPKITEHKTKSIRTCDLSGAIIMPGSSYYNYRPMIDNISSGKTYVLKRTIQTELAYYDFFPQTLYEFEDLSLKLDSDYIISDDYWGLSENLRLCLSLKELRKRR